MQLTSLTMSLNAKYHEPKEFSTYRLDLIRNMLNSFYQKQIIKPFDIRINDQMRFKRATDLGILDSTRLVNDFTEKLVISIYASEIAQRPSEYFEFFMPENLTLSEISDKPESKANEEAKKGISLAELDAIVAEKLGQERFRWEHDQLKKDFEASKRELEEANNLIEKLEKAVITLKADNAELKQNRIDLSSVAIGGVLSVVLHGLIKKYPDFLSKMPFGDVLSGLVTQEENKTGPEPEVTFSKKPFEKLSPEDEELLNSIRQCIPLLNPEQKDQFTAIFCAICFKPELLKTLAELVSDEKSTQK